MFTLEDIATSLNVKINTLRYWIKKNNDDCEKNFYEFNLSDLLQKLNIYRKTKGRQKARHYAQYIVLDIDEFKTEYSKYINYIENIKKQKRSGGLCWSGSAIECYRCNMNCHKCFNKEICASVIEFEFDKEPPMKNFVRKLLSKIGKPPL